MQLHYAQDSKMCSESGRSTDLSLALLMLLGFLSITTVLLPHNTERDRLNRDFLFSGLE